LIQHVAEIVSLDASWLKCDQKVRSHLLGVSMFRSTEGLVQTSTAMFSRRVAMALGCSLPQAVMAEEAPPNPDVTNLVQRAERANAAFVRGDMTAWFGIVSPIANDFTLMQPFGGPPSRGFDGSLKHLGELARYFRNGEATLEVVETYVVAEMVVLVMIERQHGEVGGLPDQDWSLRVTLVYQRRYNDWQLVHRHADPLVRNIGLDRAAGLARP
jgi:ketosteroid isomerase-like protein